MADENKKAQAEHLTDENFKKFLEDAGETPVFVDFYAEWCGPCKIAAPVVDKLAGEYEGKAKIVKVDVDENNQSAAENGVMSIPTVVIFKAGKEVDRKIGFPGEEEYKKMIDKHLA